MKVIDTVEMINNGIDQQEVIIHNYFGDVRSLWSNVFFKYSIDERCIFFVRIEKNKKTNKSWW